MKANKVYAAIIIAVTVAFAVGGGIIGAAILPVKEITHCGFLNKYISVCSGISAGAAIPISAAIEAKMLLKKVEKDYPWVPSYAQYMLLRVKALIEMILA